MKKFYYILQSIASLCLMLNTPILKGQTSGEIWSCHTTYQSNYSNYSSVDGQIVNENPKILNVYFHILRRTDGTGGLSTQQINNTITRLYSDYRQFNIFFYELGRSNINNTFLYNGITDNSYPQLINTYRQDNAINIYLLSPNDNYSRTEDIPSKALCIGGQYSGTSVISHETGHALGLFHTHSGSGCYDYVNCKENINQSNCTTCGDLICDTPADPCLSGKVDINCQYIGGAGYKPDVNNIMSYAPPSCLTRFSDGQRKRIHHTLVNSSILNNIFYYRPSISGPSTVCFEAKYEIEVPNNMTVQWSVNNTTDFEIIKNEGKSVTIHAKTYNKTAILTADIGQGYIFEKQISSCSLDINGSSEIQCFQSSFSISTTPPDMEYIKWTSSSSIQIISGQNQSTVTVKGIQTDASGWIELEIKRNGVVHKKRKSIYVKVPQTMNIAVINQWEENGVRHALVKAEPIPYVWSNDYYSYDWSASAGASITPCAEPPYKEPSYVTIEWGDNFMLPASSPSPFNIYEPSVYDPPVELPYADHSFAVVKFFYDSNYTVRCSYITSCGNISGSKAFNFLACSISYDHKNRTIYINKENNAVNLKSTDMQLKLYKITSYQLIKTIPFKLDQQSVSIPINDLPANSYVAYVIDSSGNTICSSTLIPF